MTKLDYRVVDHQENLAEYEIIQNGLNDHASQFEVPLRDYLNVFCYEDNTLIGAAAGNIVLPRLNIKWLWVSENYRGQNVGRNLITKLENVAQDKKCDRIFVDTMSYQAPGFYKKMGYEEAARIKEFHPGNDRIFYHKSLVK